MTPQTPSDRRHVWVAGFVAVGLGLLALLALTGPDVDRPGPVDGPGPTSIGVDDRMSGSDGPPGGVEKPVTIATSQPDTRAESSAWTTLRGLVRDRDGRRIEGVAIELNGRGDADHEVRSAADGTFVVERMVAGDYQVIARGPGILTYSGFLDVEAGVGEFEHELVVDTGWLLLGEVVDAGGQPVADARVTPWRRGPTAEELDPRAAAATNAGGLFELRGEPTGLTYALVEHPDFAPRKIRLDPRRTARVQLEPAKSSDHLRRE